MKPPHFFFQVTKKMPIQFTFLSRMILYQFCEIKSINFYLRQTVPYDMACTTFYQFAFFSIQKKKVIVNKVISILKWCLQLASIHSISSFIYHLYIQRKTTKKFNFELLCLFYVPYDIQLLMCFKESRRLFFFFETVMFQVTIEGLSIKNIQKV